MKLFSRMPIVYAVLAALSCVPSIKAQDQLLHPPVTYTYKAVNVTGATSTLVYGINNSDELVGYYTGAGCSQPSCGFLWSKGTLTTVQCALENYTDVFDISNAGEVVGTYAYFGGVHGFIWEGNSSCTDIVDPLGPTQTEAWGVNSSGVIVGFYINSSGLYQGFEYNSGTYTTISCAGWTNTRAYSINNAGIIVGDVFNSTAGPFSGFAYKSGKCIIFNDPSGSSTFARGINNKTEITGLYNDAAGTHGFFESGGVFQPINYPAASATLAYHLNDQGQIPGFYTDSSGATHGFVAIPK